MSTLAVKVLLGPSGVGQGLELQEEPALSPFQTRLFSHLSKKGIFCPIHLQQDSQAGCTLESPEELLKAAAEIPFPEILIDLV